MNIRVVRAMLYFKTPHGDLKKSVNWSIYEARALYTPTVTARDAFNKFLNYGANIINSSFRDLQYLAEISFYEETRDVNKLFYQKENKTETIRIIRSGDDIEFEVKK